MRVGYLLDMSLTCGHANPGLEACNKLYNLIYSLGGLNEGYRGTLGPALISGKPGAHGVVV